MTDSTTNRTETGAVDVAELRELHALSDWRFESIDGINSDWGQEGKIAALSTMAEVLPTLLDAYEELTELRTENDDQRGLLGDRQAAVEQLRHKLAGHDEGLDRWCHYQDRLVEALDRLGLRQRVLAELERDGWRNVPECAHKAERDVAYDVIRRLLDVGGL